MRYYIPIGPVPAEEECIQVREENYQERSRKECNRFIERIRQVLGSEPEGAKLAIKSFPHDFGNYLEVVCWYDENYPNSIKYAYCCESNAPIKWTDE